jgi:hypothetical protein
VPGPQDRKPEYGVPMVRDVHISLAQEEWTCLSENVPANSPIAHLLEASQSTEHSLGIMTIDCSKEEAEWLLEVARLACPGVVLAIHKAISRGVGPH